MTQEEIDALLAENARLAEENERFRPNPSLLEQHKERKSWREIKESARIQYRDRKEAERRKKESATIPFQIDILKKNGRLYRLSESELSQLGIEKDKDGKLMRNGKEV
ncbi:hypothetical protein ACWATR_37105 [Nostoc sp. UIC 10890]